MKKNITRRSFLKKSIGMFLSFAGLGYGGKYYINKIEPNWLEINHIVIKNPTIPKGFDGTKIVQFSDTHLGFQFQLDDLKNIIQIINSFAADLVVFTGDLMDKPDQYPSFKQIIPIMGQCKAKLGKYCVFGNHDHGGYGSELYSSIMEQANFKVLRNAHETIQLLNQDKLYVAGLDDAMLGKPDFNNTLSGIPEGSYTILLSHAPDTAITAAKHNVQLQLSGHSHGGQIQIPFAGALVTPPFAEIYREGTYHVGSLKLHVNRGLGTTRMPYRFLSRPEITVFKLQSDL